MPKNRKNAANMLRTDFSEGNTCEISSLCAVSEKLALAPNWNENRFLNTLITRKSGITHSHQVRTGSGKSPSLPPHQNSGSLIFCYRLEGHLAKLNRFKPFSSNS